MLEDEVNSRVQALSDLGVQSNQLDPAVANQLKQTVCNLRAELEQFGGKLAEKEHVIKDLIKENERSQRQAHDFQRNAKDLQRWFDDARRSSLQLPDTEALTRELDERARKVG
jgi:predicted nuclease with TOPRIM domain